jgi:hypothetical protein
VNRYRTIALTALAGLVLVACGSAASQSKEPGGASQPASQAAQASGGGAEASFGAGVVAELEALIPDTVGTMTMKKESMRGNDYLVAQGSDEATIQFIRDLGVSPSDISMAFGSGADQTAGSFAFVFIVRAQGASSDKLLSAFETAMSQDAASPVQWTDSTVGGKHVRVTASDTGSTYVYVKGDTVFWIITTVADDAAKVLGGLP